MAVAAEVDMAFIAAPRQPPLRARGVVESTPPPPLSMREREKKEKNKVRG